MECHLGIIHRTFRDMPRNKLSQCCSSFVIQKPPYCISEISHQILLPCPLIHKRAIANRPTHSVASLGKQTRASNTKERETEFYMSLTHDSFTPTLFLIVKRLIVPIQVYHRELRRALFLEVRFMIPKWHYSTRMEQEAPFIAFTFQCRKAWRWYS